MKRLLTCLLLAGCSAGGETDSSSCYATHAYETDQYSETGLHLHPTINEVGNFYSFLSFEQIEDEYIDLERCMVDTNTPGPNVLFTSFNHIGTSIELAFYSFASQTAYIDTDVEEWLPERNCISDREFLRHEFGHHVLFMNGLDDSHLNEAFPWCSALGPKSCNGEYCE